MGPSKTTLTYGVRGLGEVYAIPFQECLINLSALACPLLKSLRAQT